MTLVDKALRLAYAAHEGQKRHEGTPYITHPVAVALMLAQRGFGETTVAAALTHDVLEDTRVSEEEIRKELGSEVLSLVQAVSYDRSLPWREQRLRYIEAVRRGSPDVKALSVADKIHNAQSLCDMHAQSGKAVWSAFNANKEQKLWFEEEMLAMLQESWKHPLVEEYAAWVGRLKDLA